MPKMIKIKLELIPDIEINLFVEKGMRKCIYYIARSKTAKSMKSFDSNKSSIYISYLDKNNLYDWAMSQY